MDGLLQPTHHLPDFLSGGLADEALGVTVLQEFHAVIAVRFLGISEHFWKGVDSPVFPAGRGWEHATSFFTGGCFSGSWISSLKTCLQLV